MHVGTEFAGAPHALQLVAPLPQFAMLVSSTQAPLQRWKPELQTKPQVPLVQFAVEFGGAVHGTHDVVPQLVTALLLTHAPLQLWKPVLQLNPQLVPSHVVVAFAREIHGAHIEPQLEIELLLTHAPPQRW